MTARIINMICRGCRGSGRVGVGACGGCNGTRFHQACDVCGTPAPIAELGSAHACATKPLSVAPRRLGWAR